MTDPNTHINYSFADIDRYLNGGMTAKEMHDLERAALQDPFLADAIEGYRSADMKTAGQHLNQITAALQKEEATKVIAMPKQKRYGWLVAASLLALIGTGILFFSRENELSKPLAINQAESNNHIDSITKKSAPAAALPDSEPSVSSDNLALVKPEEKEANARVATRQQKQYLPGKEKTIEPAEEYTEEPAFQQDTPQTSMAYAAPQPGKMEASKQAQPAPVQLDSIQQHSASSEVVVNNYKKREATNNDNGWTTDKGKPFRLSEVEVVNMGRKTGKKANTTSVKPEGGWRAFQDYLFSRLSHQDSLLLVNSNAVPDNLELEFSLDESGSPYDIQVFHAKDSMLANKIINAIQSGPKWTGDSKNEKRLRLRY